MLPPGECNRAIPPLAKLLWSFLYLAVFELKPRTGQTDRRTDSELTIDKRNADGRLTVVAEWIL